MKNVIALLVGLSINTAAYAQNIKGATFLRVNPLAVADPWGAMLPVGAEYGLAKRVSVSAEIYLPLFYLFNGNMLLNEGSKITSDIKYRAEARWYLKKDIDDATPFLALEFTQRWQEYDVTRPGYYFSNDNRDAKFRYEKGHVKRDRTTLAMIFGWRGHVSGPFYIEGNLGLGVKTFSVYNDADVVREWNKTRFFSFISPRQLKDFQGTVTNLYTPISLRVSMQL